MEEIVDFDVTHTSHRQVFSVLQLTITCDSLLQNTSTDDSDVTGLIRTGSVDLVIHRCTLFIHAGFSVGLLRHIVRLSVLD